MANWLGNPENIAQGWGPAPKLDAPSIGGLVSAILANRLARDKMSQEGIADAIRNVREERQSAEYLEAMKAAGLVPQDYEAGGIGGAKMGTGLAKMIQDKKEFEALEEHRRAMEARIGGHGGGRSRGGGGEETGELGADIPETYTDEHGREWRRTSTGWTLIPKYGQSHITPQQTAQEEVVRPVLEAAKGAQTEAERRKKIMEERFGKPAETEHGPELPATGFGAERKAKAQVKYALRLQEEAAAKKRQEELLKKYPGLTAPQPAPAETTGKGADQNLATGYGKTVSDEDVEALTWARAHPGDPRSAAILQKLGIQ